MSELNLIGAIALIEEIDPTEDEVEKIFSLFGRSLRNLKAKDSKTINRELSELIKDRESLNKDEIIDWIKNKLDPRILLELQDRIVKNRELFNEIQKMIMRNMLK